MLASASDGLKIPRAAYMWGGNCASFKAGRTDGICEMSDAEDGAADVAPMPPKILSPAAERALAEAEARRQAMVTEPKPKELNGREGPEPARYGDWENKGIASDF